MFQSKENQRWTVLIQSCFSLKQRCSVLKQRCSVLKQRCSALKQRWIFQFWTALIQRKSELISADVFHILWISAEKCQNYETPLFSADYLWDFNPGCYVRIWTTGNFLLDPSIECSFTFWRQMSSIHCQGVKMIEGFVLVTQCYFMSFLCLIDVQKRTWLSFILKTKLNSQNLDSSRAFSNRPSLDQKSNWG